METSEFDRVARIAAGPSGRRAALKALLGLAFIGSSGEVGGAERRGGERHHRGRSSSAIWAERKKRKSKKHHCKPRCAGRVCGPDNCGGTCGSCGGITACDSQGQCVGCFSATDCAALPCKEATCAAGVCRYRDAANGTGCGGGRICCTGDCINTRTDPSNCGGCGAICAADQACFASVCVAGCDVCATGCEFTSIQAAVDAVAPGRTVRICAGIYPGRVVISRDLTLAGTGADADDTVLTHSAGPIVTVEAGTTVAIRNLGVSGAIAGDPGGILNLGTLTLEGVAITNNVGDDGAGSRTQGETASLLAIDCIVSGNQGRIGGGLAVTNGGQITLKRTRIENNKAANGGGVYNAGTLILQDNARITSNEATGSNGFYAGGIANSGKIVIQGNVSVTGNIPDDCFNYGGTGCPF
ncbi:MAG: hypothetical protein U0031_17530 [Thermomicrobiales bacterium]